MTQSNLKYLIKLIDLYGPIIAYKGKNTYYPPELKQEMFDKVLVHGISQRAVSLEYGLPDTGLLANWPSKYKKNAYTTIEKQRGRAKIMGRKPKKTWEEMIELERLQEENERL